MEITEVRIKLMEDSDDRLQAFCSVTFDNAFVVRDLKIIDGVSGPFVAMPSRKLTAHCPGCGYKNHLRASYCNQCGSRLKEDRTHRDADGRIKLYADIAHPINAACREQIQTRVIAEFRAELDRSQQPGYVSRYDDDYDAGDFEPESESATPTPPPTPMPPPFHATRDATAIAAGPIGIEPAAAHPQIGAPSSARAPENSTTLAAAPPRPVEASQPAASSSSPAASAPTSPPTSAPATCPAPSSAAKTPLEAQSETRLQTHRVDAPASQAVASRSPRVATARPAGDTFGAGIFD